MINDRTLHLVTKKLQADPNDFDIWMELIYLLIELKQFKAADHTIARGRKVFSSHVEKLKKLNDINKEENIKTQSDIETETLQILSRFSTDELFDYLKPHLKDTSVHIRLPYLSPYILKALIHAHDEDELSKTAEFLMSSNAIKINSLSLIAEYFKSRNNHNTKLQEKILMSIIELDSENEFAILTLANVYINLKQYNKSRSLLVRAIRKKNKNLSFIQLLSFTYLQAKEFKKCLSHSQLIAGQFKYDYHLQFNSACALIGLGRLRQASYILDNLIREPYTNIYNKSFIELLTLCCQDQSLRQRHQAKLDKAFNAASELQKNKKAVALMVIFKLLQSEYSRAEQIIDRYNDNKLYNSLPRLQDEKEDQFADAYFYYLLKLRKLWNFSEYSSDETKSLFILGDSHIYSLHTHLLNSSENVRVNLQSIFGLKYYHLSHEKRNTFQTLFIQNVNSMAVSSKVVLSLGEIDCRPSEGFLRNNATSDDEILCVLRGALSYIHSVTRQKRLSVCVLNVPAPTPKSIKTDSRVISLIKRFNDHLADLCKFYDFELLDVYSVTSQPNGQSNMQFHIDDIHLHPDAYRTILL